MGSKQHSEPHRADPECDCERCRKVYEEWGEAAAGFQKWYERYGSRFLTEKAERPPEAVFAYARSLSNPASEPRHASSEASAFAARFHRTETSDSNQEGSP